MEEIITDRLILRELTIDDFQDLYDVLKDSDIREHYPYTIDEKRVKNWIKINQNCYLNPIVGSVLLALGLLLARYNYCHYNLHLEMWGGQYQKYYLVFPAAILSSFGIIYLSNGIRNAFLSYLGKATLPILAFHQEFTIPLFVYFIAPSWVNKMNNYESTALLYLGYVLVNTCFSICFLVGIYAIIIHTPLAFILNRKIPDIYVRFYHKIKEGIIYLWKKNLIKIFPKKEKLQQENLVRYTEEENQTTIK